MSVEARCPHGLLTRMDARTPRLRELTYVRQRSEQTEAECPSILLTVTVPNRAPSIADCAKLWPTSPYTLRYNETVSFGIHPATGGLV